MAAVLAVTNQTIAVFGFCGLDITWSSALSIRKARANKLILTPPPGPTKLSPVKTSILNTIEAASHQRRWIPIALLAAVVGCFGWLFAGCVPTSVQPFYREADLVHDPALLGNWKDKPDGKERWNFTAAEGKRYQLEIQSDDQRAVFVAQLFKLGNERFLDLYPAKSALKEKLEKNPYGVALIPGHLFVRVRATDPRLRMSCMGLDWVNQQLKREPTALAHIMAPEDRVVFTGTTEAMQAFIKQHLNDADAWNDMYDEGLVRVGTAPAAN